MGSSEMLLIAKALLFDVRIRSFGTITTGATLASSAAELAANIISTSFPASFQNHLAVDNVVLYRATHSRRRNFHV